MLLYMQNNILEELILTSFHLNEKGFFNIIFPLLIRIADFDHQDSSYTYSWILGTCAYTALLMVVIIRKGKLKSHLHNGEKYWC